MRTSGGRIFWFGSNQIIAIIFLSIVFTIERKDRTYKARADGGTPFLVGLSTHYRDKTTGDDFQGLYNVPTNSLPKLLYTSSDYQGTFGFWLTS